MKPLGIWFGIAALAYGALFGAYHAYLSAKPHRIVVVIDASYDMGPAWPRIDGLLDAIQSRRYAEFSLFTNKNLVHGWSAHFSPGPVKPYGPRDFTRLAELRAAPQFEAASEIILITNAADADISAYDDWTITRPAP